jgi:hypothetical protein
VVLEKDVRSCEKGRNSAKSQGEEEYPKNKKNIEGYLDWSHYA